MTTAEVAQILVETGHKHHAAYIEADGVDPEWALWYAGYIQGRIWDGLGRIPTRSELVYVLISAERAFGDSDNPPDQWPQFYAERIVAAISST